MKANKQGCPSCKDGCGGIENYYYCPCCVAFVMDGEYVLNPMDGRTKKEIELLIERIKKLEAEYKEAREIIKPVLHAITNEQLHRAQEDLIVFMANKPISAIVSEPK
jgi:hypothetical protein